MWDGWCGDSRFGFIAVDRLPCQLLCVGVVSYVGWSLQVDCYESVGDLRLSIHALPLRYPYTIAILTNLGKFSVRQTGTSL